jgi:hypothetical protein
MKQALNVSCCGDYPICFSLTPLLLKTRVKLRDQIIVDQPAECTDHELVLETSLLARNYLFLNKKSTDSLSVDRSSIKCRGFILSHIAALIGGLLLPYFCTLSKLLHTRRWPRISSLPLEDFSSTLYIKIICS